MLFALKLVIERAVLYGNVSFSVEVLSTKKLEKLLFFQKTCFKNKAIKTCKISSDSHIKIYRSLKRKAILKIPITVLLKKPMFYLLALKWNLDELVFSCVKTKTNSHFTEEQLLIFCLCDESPCLITLNWIIKPYRYNSKNQGQPRFYLYKFFYWILSAVFPFDYR